MERLIEESCSLLDRAQPPQHTYYLAEFQVEIHSTIIFISQDLVYFNHITSNTLAIFSLLSLSL